MIATKKILLGGFIGALFIRLLFVFCVPHRVFLPDSAQYHAIAANLINGQGYSIEPGRPTARRAPLYPLFLASVYATAGTNPVFVQIMQSIVGALACLLVFLIAKELFEDSTAIVSFAIAAIHPVIISYSGVLLTENLFACFLALSALLIIRALKSRSAGRYFPAGIALGAATLTRPEIVLLPSVVLGLALVSYARKWKAVLHTLILASGTALVFAPWALRNYRVFNYVFVGQSEGLGTAIWGSAQFVQRGSDNAENLKTIQQEYDKLQRGLSASEFEKRTLREGLSIILANPVRSGLVLLKRLPEFWITSHSSMFNIDKPNAEYRAAKQYHLLAIKSLLLLAQVALLALTCIGFLWAAEKSAPLWFLLTLILYPSLFAWVDLSARHHVPYLPYLIIIASFALTTWRERLRGRDAVIPSRLWKIFS